MAQSTITHAHHDHAGTHYGESAFQNFNPGDDEALFLYPYVLPAITGDNVRGKKIVDHGSGLGSCAIHAAREGAAEVWAYDYQSRMVTAAKFALAAEKERTVRKAVHFLEGDANNVFFLSNGEFHLALSNNLGCDLPSPSLVEHFREMYRLLKKRGQAVVTLPESLDVVFTTAGNDFERDEILERLKEKLAVTTVESIHDLDGFPGILRATIIAGKGGLRLIEPGEQLEDGAEIFRIIPGLVVPNRYHQLETYLMAAEGAGFLGKEVIRRRFENQREWQMYNAKNPDKPLGREYSEHFPFAVIQLHKPG